MNINLIVNGGVYGSQAAYSAYRFACAAVSEHTISQVFFYQDGVTQANDLSEPLADEFNPPQAWSELAQRYGIELVVCISAAERRGILGPEQQTDLAKSANNLHSCFNIQGLGAMLDASLSADRTVTFK